METVKITEPVIAEPVPLVPKVLTKDEKNAVPETTEEQDRKTRGQRFTNNIWEITQAGIAIIVTLANIYSEVTGHHSEILGNAFTLIIAIYFVRMNHVKVGGVGGTDTR